MNGRIPLLKGVEKQSITTYTKYQLLFPMAAPLRLFGLLHLLSIKNAQSFSCEEINALEHNIFFFLYELTTLVHDVDDKL